METGLLAGILQQMTEIAIQLDDELLTRLRTIAARDGRVLEDLIADGAHLIAANEDEPAPGLTPDQVAAIEEGQAQLRRGEGVAHDEAMRQVRDALRS